METQVLSTSQDTVANGSTPDKTCRITVVNQGLSDTVIKVHPSEHESELVWLDNTQGIERWEAIRRFMYQYAKRGTAIPRPVPLCKSKNLAVVDLQEHEIPIVELEQGFFLKAPPEVQRITRTELPKIPTDPEIEKRVSSIEKGMDEIKGLVGAIAERLDRARPEVPTGEKPDTLNHHCGECDKSFSGKHALAIHVGRFHKKGDK